MESAWNIFPEISPPSSTEWVPLNLHSNFPAPLYSVVPFSLKTETTSASPNLLQNPGGEYLDKAGGRKAAPPRQLQVYIKHRHTTCVSGTERVRRQCAQTPNKREFQLLQYLSSPWCLPKPPHTREGTLLWEAAAEPPQPEPSTNHWLCFSPHLPTSLDF